MKKSMMTMAACAIVLNGVFNINVNTGVGHCSVYEGNYNGDPGWYRSISERDKALGGLRLKCAKGTCSLLAGERPTMQEAQYPVLEGRCYRMNDGTLLLVGE